MIYVFSSIYVRPSKLVTCLNDDGCCEGVPSLATVLASFEAWGIATRHRHAFAKYHSSPTQLHTSLLHSQRQLVTHNIGVPMKQATWGHQGSTHHTLFQGGRAGQIDQPAAAGQCASCKLQTTKPKACSNQLRQQQISTMHTLNIHTQHK